MPYEDVEKFEQIAKGKIKFLEEHFGRYFLRAIMAGFFIAVAMIYSNVVGNLFSESDPAMGKFLSGIVFSIAVLYATRKFLFCHFHISDEADENSDTSTDVLKD